MKKEKISIRRKETSIKLQASLIDSIRVKDIERNAVRVYRDGFIGISGAVGASQENELTDQAINNLSSKIPYPYELESNKVDHRNYQEKHYTENALMELTETIIDSLNNDFQDFMFSNSIKTVAIDYKLENTEGLDLRYQDEHLEIGLVVKAKSSPNLFDTFVGWDGRHIDLDKFLTFAKKQLTAERNVLELPTEEKIPCIFLSPDSLGSFLMSQLNGETYGNKASFFDGKLNQKIFHEKLNIVQNRDPKTTNSAFFDAEGVIKENDKVTLVENGVLKRVFTDKKNAKAFNLEHTGSASGGYDDIPRLAYSNIRPCLDSKDMFNTLNGQKAIFVMVAAGGEFSADGNYATPVQASYLFDGKNLIGKLPNFFMSNDIYSMLGTDYIGTFPAEELYYGEEQTFFSCYMNIKK